MRRIKLIIALVAAVSTLLALAAAPAMADDFIDNDCIGVFEDGHCIGVGDDFDGFCDDFNFDGFCDRDFFLFDQGFNDFDDEEFDDCDFIGFNEFGEALFLCEADFD